MSGLSGFLPKGGWFPPFGKFVPAIDIFFTDRYDPITFFSATVPSYISVFVGTHIPATGFLSVSCQKRKQKQQLNDLTLTVCSKYITIKLPLIGAVQYFQAKNELITIQPVTAVQSNN